MASGQLLTDTLIKSLPKARPGKRALTYDEGRGSVAGFAVMVTDTGSKSYVLQARINGSPSRRAIGTVGSMTLSKARDIAKDWRDLIASGKDPKLIDQEKAREAARRRGDTVNDVADRYVKSYVRGKERKRGAMRTADDSEYIIDRHIRKRWGKRPISEITPDDIMDLCEVFKSKGQVAHGRNTFQVTRSLFKWAVNSRKYAITRNPCDGLMPATLIGSVQHRKRALSDAEIAVFWRACETLGYPYGPLYKLVLLCALRRDEAAEASWPEISDSLWTIPEERYKSGRSFLVTLPRQAKAILDELPRFKSGEFIFTTTAGEKPVSGHSKAKIRLDAAMTALLPAGEELEAFVIHDLRRTARTGLSKLRVPAGVAEAILGHGKQGLVGIYDMHDMAEEKAAALQRWADHVENVVAKKHF